MTLKRLAWVLPYLLPLLGCILVSAAALVVALPLGLLVSGVACWVAEWHIETERRKR